MKYINNLLFVLAVLALSGCSDVFELDINTNPNQVAPENAELSFLYNQSQLGIEELSADIYVVTANASRMICMTSFFYNEAYSPTSFNQIWFDAYSRLMPDLDAVINLATQSELTIHSGSAKVMKAYTLLTLVDVFGNVPYSESGKGVDPISPKRDEGSSVYAAANALLDDALTDLVGSTAAAPELDMFYAGSADSWAKLANSLKLKAALNTKDAGTISSIVSNGNFITEAGDDWQFQYGTNRDQLNTVDFPSEQNSRHPLYNDWYEANDGDYMSNYYMWLLDGSKSIEDPRLRFYFYRQDGNLTNEDPNIWDCILTNEPFDVIPPGQFDHYLTIDPNLPFCIASEDGYFGRDHGNGSGIPPDGPVRTVYGLYPAGGRWDDNSFSFTQNNGVDGALGAGIQPLMLSSFIDFMRAEAALSLGTTDDPRALLESGMRKSITKVLSFVDLVSAADLARVVGTNPSTQEPITAQQQYGVSTDDIEAYVTEVLANYDAADATGKLNIVVTEYYIALWGNGLEAYNLYRRTAMPLNMPPLIDPQAAVSSSFVRSHLYPAVHVDLNQNATQKSTDEPVFWDTNPSSMYR